MGWWRTSFSLFVLSRLALIPSISGAQVVRGIVADAASRLPVAGIVVTLELAPDSAGRGAEPVRSVLTNEQGEYAIRAPSPGRYRVVAKRIGAQRLTSASFGLQEGETRQLDVALNSLLPTLPEVAVKGMTTCSGARAQGERLATLWEEVRSALTATTVAARDSLVSARFVRYTRSLDARNLRVVDENLYSYDSRRGDLRFRSLPGDSLSNAGYWRQVGEQSTIFYAPDADALLSEAFVRDHCFTLVEGAGDRRGLVGLSFAPTARRALARSVPEIQGTMWLDARSSELQFVEFTWTRLPGSASTRNVGGRVYFVRLSAGPWIVKRWYLRMPQDLLELGGGAAGSSRTLRLGLKEEGGGIISGTSGPVGKPGSLTGTVRDAGGKPLAGALVRLLGTPYATTTDGKGRYALEGVPSGLYTVLSDHDRFARFGVPAGRADVLLDEGSSRQADLRAPRPQDIVVALCGGTGPVRGLATLRITLIDSATHAPVIAQRLRLVPLEAGVGPRAQAATDVKQIGTMSAATDSGGVAVFCSLPGGRSFDLIMDTPGRHTVLGGFRLEPNAIVASVIQTHRAGRQ